MFSLFSSLVFEKEKSPNLTLKSSVSTILVNNNKILNKILSHLGKGGSKINYENVSNPNITNVTCHIPK